MVSKRRPVTRRSKKHGETRKRNSISKRSEQVQSVENSSYTESEYRFNEHQEIQKTVGSACKEKKDEVKDEEILRESVSSGSRDLSELYVCEYCNW